MASAGAYCRVSGCHTVLRNAYAEAHESKVAVVRAPTTPPAASAADPYNNPFRDARVTPERVDMGVDYSGTGPIYALGPGVITEADTAWSGAVGAPYPGTFITERITQGSLKGKYIYIAEDIASAVHVGQHVDSNTVLGMFTGGNQLETGFAVGPGSPGTTLAMARGQSSTSGDPGASPTAYGEAYNQVLQSQGAPKGVISSTPVGTLPKNWPTPSSNNNQQPQQAQTTSFSLNPISWLTNLTGLFASGGKGADYAQRFGLIVFGGALVLIGVWLLAGKQTIKLAVTSLVPEASAAEGASDG